MEEDVTDEVADATINGGTRNGLVGAHVTGVHHIGIPVRSIERSLAWYGELFGLEPDFVEVSEGQKTSQTVQLENARLRFAFLPIGGTIIEFLEYERPIGDDFDLRNCDVGAIHVCLEVDDIDQVHRVLSERGVKFSIGPTAQQGAIAGHACCYFRDPDGIQLELWQRPRRTASPTAAIDYGGGTDVSSA
jgi:catechol 2,3-dioxygenase-like lactoylglutathione lyase family enzyme